MLQRLACVLGKHAWEVNRSTIKEPFAGDSGVLLVNVRITEERFCPICNLKGGTSTVERVEVFENEVEEEESWGA